MYVKEVSLTMMNKNVFREFFTGWRSTFITAISMKDKWYFLGIPGLVRVRRMAEEAPTIPGEGGVVGGVLGGDSLGKVRALTTFFKNTEMDEARKPHSPADILTNAYPKKIVAES